jgi:hypothetical protein
MERSQIVGVLSAMKRGEKLVAMVAPAADRQFPGTIEQLLSACVKAGFSDVIEVALGAEKTAQHETEEFLEFFDLHSIYPVASDFSRDTEKLNGAQRTLLYNIFRSNPMINGFSFTSFGVANEGALQGNLVIKDSLAYAIQQGHEPLRFSLFTSERAVYAGKPFAIEAVLCNEDVLAPGNYAAVAYIRGADGCVWRKNFTLSYPENGFGGMPPLAATVLYEEITLPAGCVRLLGNYPVHENKVFAPFEAAVYKVIKQ